MRKVSKGIDPISDFPFLSAAKSGKSRIKNLFLDSPKETHTKTIKEIRRPMLTSSIDCDVPLANFTSWSYKGRKSLTARAGVVFLDDFVVLVVIVTKVRLLSSAASRKHPTDYYTRA